MKYHIVFTRKNKKDISKCRLLKCLPSMQSVNLNECARTFHCKPDEADHSSMHMPRKPASENVVCLCLLLNILANFSNLEEQSDLGPHCLQK